MLFIFIGGVQMLVRITDAPDELMNSLDGLVMAIMFLLAKKIFVEELNEPILNIRDCTDRDLRLLARVGFGVSVVV